MPILGSSSSGGKGSVPGTPTVGTATVTNSTTVSLTFTAPFSKLPITSYTVTSSPSIALSTSGTSSPLTVTGSFASGQAYTFTIAAVNSNGASNASAASNSVTPVAVYALLQTYNSSTTFTVPSGITKLAVYAFGGGGGGSIGGSASDGNGGAGGGGGGGAAWYDYTVTPGQVYTITVGSGGNAAPNYLNTNANSGNASLFISPNSTTLLDSGFGAGANAGTSGDNPQSPGQTILGGSNNYTTNLVTASTGRGGNRALGNNTNTGNGASGGGGVAASALSLTLDGVSVSYTHGGGGGGGGGGGFRGGNIASGTANGGGGGSGGSPSGGNAGSGGTATKNSTNSGSANSGNAGNSGTAPSGGGAGGGGRGLEVHQDGNYIEASGGAGGNGAAGRIYVYGK